LRTRRSLLELAGGSLIANVWCSASAGRGLPGGHPYTRRRTFSPELTAHAIRDWCRTSGAETVYIDPGASWQNPWVESFNARLRDELLAVEQSDSLL